MRAAWEIDAFRPADGPPPQTLGRFFMWCLSGSWGPLVTATLLSAIAGTMEVVTAWYLGKVVDAAGTETPATIFTNHWQLLVSFIVFLMILRPFAFGLSAASNSVIVQPNVLPLVLSRLHRWTMGHAVTFFDNDFAGRIAQKQMQAARAVTDVASESINTVAFALASLIGSAVFSCRSTAGSLWDWQPGSQSTLG